VPAAHQPGRCPAVIRSVDSYSVFTTQPGEHARGWPSQPCRRSTLATSAAVAQGSHL